jgi:hypothetical protein
MAKKTAGKTTKRPAAKKTPAKKTPARKVGKAAPKPAKTAARGEQQALYALVIGCDLYLPNRTPEGSYPSLRGCVSDAKRVAEFLRKRAGLADDRLTYLTSTDSADRPGQPAEPPGQRPTYENIVGAFQEITRRAARGDHVYIHYSGHGGRCPTIVPKVKGRAATDEALVPIDIGDKKARYVRDVEIAKLLRDMTDKGLIVTAVFDSCHSGGATRAVSRADDPTGIRGVDFVDKTSRPTDSLVGTPHELAVATPPEDPTRGPGQTRGVAPADAAATGCVVLAACRPFELAREFMFDGGPSQGALTYWFLKAVGDGAEGLSFRTVYEQVTARIHDQFPSQTPMLFGNPDRAILGAAAVATTPAVPVTGTSGQTVTLGAGQAALVQVGAEYAVYPAGAKDLADTTARVAVVQVTAVRPVDSSAAVTQTFQARGVRAGDRAVPVGTPLRLVRKIDVLRPDGKAPAPADEALRRVAAALTGQTWVEPASRSGEPADFVVTTDKNGAFYQICDASDVPVPIRPALPTANTAAPTVVVERLVHLARFQAVQTLENSDPLSPLRGGVVVELLETPNSFQKGDPTAGLKPYPAGAVPRLKPGNWVVLSVTNRSAKPINVVVLDLSSDWSVSVAHPEDRFLTIAPGDEPLRLALQAALPVGQTQGYDVLKVIATVEPPSGFELLTLPPLDQPIPRAGERASVTRSPGTLGALLAAVTADRPTRALNTGGQPTGGWAVNHVKVEVG